MKKTFLLGAASVALMAPGLASALTIDTFSMNQMTEDTPDGDPNASQVADGGALGGFRDVQSSNDQAASGGTTANVSGGNFSVSNESGNSGDGLLTYDGDDDPASVTTNGLGGINLAVDDMNMAFTNGSFIFDVISNDLPWNYIIQVWDSDSTATVNGVIDGANNGGVGSELIPFSSFGGIDFTDVGALQLVFDGSFNADLTIDLLGTTGDTPPPTGDVPLPASAFLMLGGLAGLGWVGHRRRKVG